MGRKLSPTQLRALVVAGLVLGALSTSSGAESQAAVEGKLELELKAGKVTGRVEDRPLADVLKRLSQLQPFDYSGPPALLERKVNKVFAGVSVSDAVRRALDGYDYYVLSNAKGVILELTVTNLSAEASQSEAKPAVAAAPSRQPGGASSGAALLKPGESEIPLVTAAPGVPLSEEERASFERGMDEGVTPELYEIFYPETPPEAVLSGPPAPPGSESEAAPFPGSEAGPGNSEGPN